MVFIKNVLKGKVKTRLAKTLGDEKALEIYQLLVNHTYQIARETKATRYTFYSHFVDHQDQWEAPHFSRHLQQGKDLGQRMEHAFAMALAQQDKAVIIGSDCISLTPAIIEQAFQKLEEHPFVIGPAMDGGYYLLGMREFSPELFSNMKYSTSSVFSETIKRMEALGKTYFALEPLSDIDTEEDWKKYGPAMDLK